MDPKKWSLVVETQEQFNQVLNWFATWGFVIPSYHYDRFEQYMAWNGTGSNLDWYYDSVDKFQDFPRITWAEFQTL